MHVVALDDAWRHIRNRDHWANHSGSMSAHPGPAASFGSLSGDWCVSASTAEYVIYSYQVPIAWITPEGEVVMPDYTYSATTSRHQMICARALKVAFRNYDPKGTRS